MRAKSGSARRTLGTLAGAGLAVLAAAGAFGQAAVDESPARHRGADAFLRVDAEDRRPVALQTSIVSFGPRAGVPADVRVDLVSAVHIADAQYYAELNRRFRDYDAVLYELVAPEGTRVPPGGGGHGGVVNGTQVAMTRLLDLTFQLDEIDYTQANFVHADLSPQQIAESMADRGESFSQYFVRLLAVALSEQAKDPYGLRDIGLLAALFSSDRARLLKAQFAVAMLDMETVMLVIEGEEGSTLVGERNKRAISVLEGRLRAGDRRVAIFYGAAHMPDMAARLERDFGFERRDAVWIDAWNLR